MHEQARFPRRVLHLRTINGKGGGPEKTLLFTPRHLGSDYDARLAYIRPHGDPEYDMPERARAMGVHLIDIPETGPADPRTLLRLHREVRDFRPHILHPHDYKTNVLAVLLGRWFRIPVVTTLHGYVTLTGKLNRYYRIDRWALRRMDYLIAVSPDLFELLESLGIPPERRVLIENAIDTETYRRQESAEVAKQRLGFSPNRLLVGAVGRLQPEKGFDLLIEAVASLHGAGVDFDLAIIGEGPERSRLEQAICERGCEQRIRLLGHRTDMMALYQAMDVFVLSSLREGLPNVLLEAMAVEVPVLATRVAGVPRLIEDRANGYLVPAEDAAMLAEGLRELLGAPALRSRLAAAARRTIEERYSFPVRMKKIRKVYDQVLAGKEPDGGRRPP